MSRRSRAIVVVMAIVGLSAAAGSAQEPAGEAKPKPPSKPPVYDEAADARADLAKAVARAEADNKRVLVVFGANWCGWCHLLAELFKGDQDIAKTLHYEYEVVKVDIGDWKKNTDLTEKFGCDLKHHGVPYLTVLDGKGAVLTNQDTGSLEAGKKHDPEKVKAFLGKWKAEPLDAEAVLKAGLAAAAKDGKLALVHFGAPWCGSCRRYEAFFGRPEIAALLAPDFVSVKIDEDRMLHGMEVEKRLRVHNSGNIPWTCVLDAEGKVLAVSEDKRGNVAHPMEPEEVACFMDMLRKTAKKWTPEQAAKLESELLAQKSRKAGN